MICFYVSFDFSISDEFWQQHPDLHEVPIYYASALAKKCMSVYQTYTNAMNEKIQRQISVNNPFQFKHISNLKVCLLIIYNFSKMYCNKLKSIFVFINWSFTLLINLVPASI